MIWWHLTTKHCGKTNDEIIEAYIFMHLFAYYLVWLPCLCLFHLLVIVVGIDSYSPCLVKSVFFLLFYRHFCSLALFQVRRWRLVFGPRPISRRLLVENLRQQRGKKEQGTVCKEEAVVGWHGCVFEQGMSWQTGEVSPALRASRRKANSHDSSYKACIASGQEICTPWYLNICHDLGYCLAVHDWYKMRFYFHCKIVQMKIR